MAWTVGEAAQTAKVSVRTLHHYDRIGLLKPSGRSEAGYRLYSETDLQQLMQVLLFKELGFSLDEIARIMSDPDYDRTDALRAQRALLAEKIRRTESTIAAIDHAIEMTEGGTTMTKEETSKMFTELFDGFDPAEYEDEVRERWGGSDAYRQSAERTKRYTKADWERIRAEGAAIDAGLVALMDAGVPADSPEAMELAEAKRRHISTWFYECPLEFYVNMAAIWVNDPRFTRNIDKRREGLAAYSYAAVVALSKSQSA